MYRLIRPILFRLDPERAHRLVFGTLATLGPVARALARLTYGPPDSRLRIRVSGLDLPGPVGLAAGLDKDGHLARFWSALGFGMVELGTVTAHPQPGNLAPRLFRFPQQRALINRMGFNNAGAQVLARRLAALSGARRRAPLGVNLGKSKITPLSDAVGDYSASAGHLRGLADYMVVNVSSPNTPGLRSLQDPAYLRDIVQAVAQQADGVPVWVKLAPDLSDAALTEAVRVSEDAGAAGIVATNTTIDHGGLPDVGAGGMSGAPLRGRAQEVIAHVCRETTLPVVGVGGLSTLEDVLAVFAAGAAAVQVYSGLIFEGPGLVSRLNQALVGHLTARGYADLAELQAALRAEEA